MTPEELAKNNKARFRDAARTQAAYDDVMRTQGGVQNNANASNLARERIQGVAERSAAAEAELAKRAAAGAPGRFGSLSGATTAIKHAAPIVGNAVKTAVGTGLRVLPWAGAAYELGQAGKEFADGNTGGGWRRLGLAASNALGPIGYGAASAVDWGLSKMLGTDEPIAPAQISLDQVNAERAKRGAAPMTSPPGQTQQPQPAATAGVQTQAGAQTTAAPTLTAAESDRPVVGAVQKRGLSYGQPYLSNTDNDASIQGYANRDALDEAKFNSYMNQQARIRAVQDQAQADMDARRLRADDDRARQYGYKDAEDLRVSKLRGPYDLQEEKLRQEAKNAQLQRDSASADRMAIAKMNSEDRRYDTDARTGLGRANAQVRLAELIREAEKDSAARRDKRISGFNGLTTVEDGKVVDDKRGNAVAQNIAEQIGADRVNGTVQGLGQLTSTVERINPKTNRGTLDSTQVSQSAARPATLWGALTEEGIDIEDWKMFGPSNPVIDFEGINGKKVPIATTKIGRDGGVDAEKAAIALWEARNGRKFAGSY